MTQLMIPGSLTIKNEAVFDNGLIRQDVDTGECEAITSFINRWDEHEDEHYGRGYVEFDDGSYFSTEFEDHGGYSNYVCFKTTYATEERIEELELWPSEGTGWYRRHSYGGPDGVQSYHLEINREALAGAYAVLIKWYASLIYDERIEELDFDTEYLSFKQQQQLADALITDWVYDQFKEYYADLVAKDKYPYNSSFVNVIDYLRAMPEDLQETAIYLMQGRYRDERTDEKKRGLVNTGYRFIDREPDLANSRKKYDQVVLFTGAGIEKFESARVCYDRDGVAEFILPKGKRSKGRAIHWGTKVVNSRAGVDLLGC